MSDEDKFWKETILAIKKDPDFLVGRWQYYRNIYGQDISLRRFKELLILKEVEFKMGDTNGNHANK